MKEQWMKQAGISKEEPDFTKPCFLGKCGPFYKVVQLDMSRMNGWNRATAVESHSCRGYRSKTRSVPRPQDSSEARP